MIMTKLPVSSYQFPVNPVSLGDRKLKTEGETGDWQLETGNS
jgi:hypothetical protein